MSVDETTEESPPPSRQISRLRTRQTARKTSKVPAAVEASSSRMHDRSLEPSVSYRVFKRDVLYRAINEFQLSGTRLSAYTDLLTQLGFDLTPLVSQGQTWYLCRGKQEDGAPCRRMVPEVYLRTAVGGILRAADRGDLNGDNLVDTLASALSYAICSEHHRTIHKVARAIDARQIVEQWRETGRTTSASTTSSRGRSTPSPVRALLDDATRALSSTQSPSAGSNKETDIRDEEDELDPVEAYGVSERLKVERHYQEYLRASSRERRSNSDAASRTSSTGASSDKNMSDARWKELERNTK